MNPGWCRYIQPWEVMVVRWQVAGLVAGKSGSGRQATVCYSQGSVAGIKCHQKHR